MNIGGLLAALLLLFAAGFGATLWLMRGAQRINLLECATLGWLFGCGLVSLGLWLGGLVLSGLALQAGVAVIAVGLALTGLISARQSGARFVFPRPENFLEWILALAIALEILLAFRSACSHGLGWDGLLNWEVKARYAFLNDGVLPPAYFGSATRAFTHPAYPLLIPLTELWVYLWMGEPNQFWIKLIFPLFYAAGAILLASSARRLTNRRWPGLLAAALLFFVPCLTNSPGDVAGGYADFPLGVFYLVAIGYLLRHASTREPGAFRIYAASLALLPWTKREGVVLWLTAAIAGAFVLWRRRESPRTWLWFLPGILIIAAWKLFLHLLHTTEAGEFVPMNFHALMANLSRALPLAKMVVREMLVTYRWSLLWPLVALALVSLAGRARDWRLLLLGSAIIAPIALYAATYLFSSWPNYANHFDASYSRLLLHVVPVAWLAIALAISRSSSAALPSDKLRQSRNR
ncbi:MAG: hypothetical protein ACR2HH_04640 [Chthoniobacterales bacterium]